MMSRASSGYAANANSTNGYSMFLAGFSRLIQLIILPTCKCHYVLYMLVSPEYGIISNLYLIQSRKEDMV